MGKRYCEKNALKTLHSANFLLDPRSNNDYELSDVKPIYTAVFTFADKPGDLRLEISWHEVQDDPDSNKSELVELSRTWTRLDRSSTTSSSLLDIKQVSPTSNRRSHFLIHYVPHAGLRSPLRRTPT